VLLKCKVRIHPKQIGHQISGFVYLFKNPYVYTNVNAFEIGAEFNIPIYIFTKNVLVGLRPKIFQSMYTCTSQSKTFEVHNHVVQVEPINRHSQKTTSAAAARHTCSLASNVTTTKRFNNPNTNTLTTTSEKSNR